MEGRHEERLPGDLQPVAARLTNQRADIDPLELDRIKQRVLARSRGESRRRGAFGTRLASLITIAALALGSGGAVALSGLDSHSNTYGGAADAMYKPHKCEDKDKHGEGGKKDKDKCEKKGDFGGAVSGATSGTSGTTSGTSGATSGTPGATSGTPGAASSSGSNGALPFTGLALGLLALAAALLIVGGRVVRRFSHPHRGA